MRTPALCICSPTTLPILFPKTFAEKLAKGPLLALRAAKTAIDTGIDGALSDGLDLEGEMFDDLFNTNDAATGIATFFEHGPGKATFTGT